MTFGTSSLSSHKSDNREIPCAARECSAVDKQIEEIKITELMAPGLKKEMEKICRKGFNFDGLSNEKWVSIWPKIIGPQFFSDSVIPIPRQTEIIRLILPRLKAYLKKKNRLLIRLGIKWAEMDEKSRNRLLEEEAWSMAATTNSKNGYRFGFGLKTGGCQYWRDHKLKIGCLNCGYFASVAIGVRPSSEQLVKQFNHALQSIELAHLVNYDVIEILSDGSFFNDKEVDSTAREKIFEIISKKPGIKRVLVETRPEFIGGKEKICKLLGILRGDQKIDIGIGLETSDRFIANFLINKGFEKEDMLEAIESLKGLKQCRILSYCLVKPAFLTDKQAIEDVIRTVKYLHDLSTEKKVEIIPKLEPVVVAEGTLLEVLNSEDEDGPAYYKPPSYWTVAEIIARLADKGLAGKVCVGAREDMDLFKAVPCIEYKIGMLSRIDFLVYLAVQQFNKHRKITKLLACLEPAFKDASFKEWMKENRIKKPVLTKLHRKYAGAIREIKATKKYCRTREFLEKVFDCLDEIEYGEKTQELAREGKIIGLNELIKSILMKRLQGTVIHISNPELLESGLKLLRMNIYIYSRELKEKYSMWVGIPTARRVELREVEGALETSD